MAFWHTKVECQYSLYRLRVRHHPMLADQSQINPNILDTQATSNPLTAQVIVQIGGDGSAASGYLFICMLKAGMDGEIILLRSISSGELVVGKYATRTIRIPPQRGGYPQ
jgi:hypothetical protein